MDVKGYYRRVREIEASLPAGDVVVVSLETPDGGRAGVATEVARFNAAQLVVEGRARLASREETEAYKEELRAALETRRQVEARQRVQVHVVTEEDLSALKTGGRSGKKNSKGDE